MRRRHFFRSAVAAATALAAAALAVDVSLRRRLRYASAMVLDVLYSRLGPPPARRTTPDHPMQYLVSLPRDAGARSGSWSIVVTIDGSDRDFRWNHAAFVRARGERPYVIVTPLVLSNGGRPNAAAYSYQPSVFRAAVADPLAFDVTGVAAMLRDVNSHMTPVSTAPLAVFLTGFSAGGHLTWLLALAHPEWFTAVAPASANFAGRGIDVIAPISTPPARERLSIRAFQGESDRIGQALTQQWASARDMALRHGFRDVSRTIVPGTGHSPCAPGVLAFFDDVQVKTGYLVRRGARYH